MAGCKGTSCNATQGPASGDFISTSSRLASDGFIASPRSFLRLLFVSNRVCHASLGPGGERPRMPTLGISGSTFAPSPSKWPYRTSRRPSRCQSRYTSPKSLSIRSILRSAGRCSRMPGFHRTVLHRACIPGISMPDAFPRTIAYPLNPAYHVKGSMDFQCATRKHATRTRCMSDGTGSTLAYEHRLRVLAPGRYIGITGQSRQFFTRCLSGSLVPVGSLS